MTLNTLIQRVRYYTNDRNGNIFGEDVIKSFINEAIDRMKDIKQFSDLQYPSDGLTEIPYIPSQYHYLLAVYSASRCFTMDEQDYKAGSLMNEFEVKFDELKKKIDNSEITIDGYTDVNTNDYITNEYFTVISDEESIDDLE